MEGFSNKIHRTGCARWILGRAGSQLLQASACKHACHGGAAPSAPAGYGPDPAGLTASVPVHTLMTRDFGDSGMRTT